MNLSLPARTPKLSALFLSLALASPLASAAVVYTQGHITAETDVLNSGTVVVANNLGAGALAVTVNGVSFGTSVTGLSGMAASGSDFSSQFAPNSPLDKLLSGLDFQNGGSSSLSLTGLTAGSDYTLQLFLANGVNSTGKTSRVSVQGQGYNIANFGNNADYLRVAFTASGTSELVTFGNGSGVESDRMVLNAYALQTVPVAADAPEPGSLVLSALGLAALGALRRRKV